MEIAAPKEETATESIILEQEDNGNNRLNAQKNWKDRNPETENAEKTDDLDLANDQK